MEKKFSYDKKFGQVMKTKECVIRMKAVVYGSRYFNKKRMPFRHVGEFAKKFNEHINKSIAEYGQFI